jgi:hypothetical protein
MKAVHVDQSDIVDLAGVIIVSIRRHDRDLHKGDLDKGSCTRERKASLKSRCDSGRPPGRPGMSRHGG